MLGMPYNPDPIQASMHRYLKKTAEGRFFVLDGKKPWVPIDDDMAFDLSQRLADRSASLKRMNIGAGIAGLIAVYAAMFSGAGIATAFPIIPAVFAIMLVVNVVTLWLAYRPMVRFARGEYARMVGVTPPNFVSELRRAAHDQRAKRVLIAALLMVTFARIFLS